VDLAFRYLPELIGFARARAPADPLVDALLALATAWPLSSVGTGGIGEVDVTPFIDHPGLRALYIDRILDRRDLARMGHPAVREAVGAAIGIHDRLAPEAAATIAAHRKGEGTT
jgi:hypothetical protein